MFFGIPNTSYTSTSTRLALAASASLIECMYEYNTKNTGTFCVRRAARGIHNLQCIYNGELNSYSSLP